MKSDKSKSITQLKKEWSSAIKLAGELRNELYKREWEVELPKLQKKYEGKFFKYENNDGTEKWFIYTYCKSVKDNNYFLGVSFEQNVIRINKFSINKELGYYLCETEITKIEYGNALFKFKKEFNKLIGETK